MNYIYVKNRKPSTLIRKDKPAVLPALFSKDALDKFVEIYAPIFLKHELKSKQEVTLKAKNFLPPQAYAPEVYLLEATPEVQQLFNSEDSTRPQTQTSYEYEFPAGNKNGDVRILNAKNSNIQNGAGFNTYQPLPQISPHKNNNQQSSSSKNQQSPPVAVNISASPQSETSLSNEKIDKDSPQSMEKFDKTNKKYQSSTNHPIKDIKVNHTSPDSQPNLRVDSPQHQESKPSEKPWERPNEEYLPPQITTPTRTGNDKANPDKPAQQGYFGGPHKHDDSYHGSQPKHDDGFYGRQHKHDVDSGIAGFTPETYRENEPLDRRKAEQDVVNDQLKPPPPEADDEDSDQYYKPQDNHDLLQWNRKQLEDQETARREEEKRAREEAHRKKHENDRQQIVKDAKLMKTAFDENLTRFPSPPPLRLASSDRDAKVAGAQRKRQKDQLLKELEEAKAERRASEQQREELVKHAKQLQAKTQNKRNHARDYWKKRYFDEKKKTEPLEEQSNGLRNELDIFHKRLLAILEGPKEKATKLNDPKGNSKVGFPTRPLNNFKIRATRLQHELDDVRHRVEHAKMKLTSEMKLRIQAETELRALRAELIQKKINLTLSRNSHLTAYAPPAADVNFMTARSTGITPRS